MYTHMKKIFLVALAAIMLTGCDKKEAVGLDLTIQPTKTSLKVNETLTFNISGNPDQLTFYSGEAGKQYELREGILIEGDGNVMNLSFSTLGRYGTTVAHPNALRLFMSQKFSGNYGVSAFKEEDWTDVSDNFVWSPLIGNDTDYKASGIKSVFDLMTLDKDKPVYFAFRYKTNAGTNQIQSRWWIEKFDIESKNLATGDPLPLGQMSSMAWTFIKLGGGITPTYNTSGLRFPSAPAANEASLIWAVSKAVSLAPYKNLTNVNRGTALKNMSTRLDQYNYVYTQPGTYKVTFVASNENVYGGSEKIIKEFDITVTP